MTQETLTVKCVETVQFAVWWTCQPCLDLHGTDPGFVTHKLRNTVDLLAMFEPAKDRSWLGNTGHFAVKCGKQYNTRMHGVKQGLQTGPPHTHFAVWWTCPPCLDLQGTDPGLATQETLLSSVEQCYTTMHVHHTRFACTPYMSCMHTIHVLHAHHTCLACMNDFVMRSLEVSSLLYLATKSEKEPAESK